ncbi:MAG: amino acid permease [Betaproteobacteria bacterium]|nr:amino acid permease [Betaproteobacteria bacterium]
MQHDTQVPAPDAAPARPDRPPHAAPSRAADAPGTPRLKRALSLPVIAFYGMGTIVGAGIYVLIGEVVGAAGMLAPVAFLVAATVAMLSAFSYAELSSRFPFSAGEAVYVDRGLGWRPLSVLVGLLIVSSGIVSSAAIARGFVGYLHVFVPVPSWAAICVLVVGLGVLAAWGIAESAAIAVVSTIVEVGGLLLVIWVSRNSLGTLPARIGELVPTLDAGAWSGIFLGAFLAFYAFIGFEDMVNVAEEVQSPERNMPRAILVATGATVALYLILSLVAVLALPARELAGHEAPLALLYTHATGRAPTAISVVGLFAVVNGALIQMIMGARTLYGMSRQGWLPGFLGVVNARTRTPLRTTALVSVAVLCFALAIPLVSLARLTSLVVLVVFTLINLSLIRVKQRGPAPPEGVWQCPVWVPVIALLSSVALIVAQVVGLAVR